MIVVHLSRLSLPFSIKIRIANRYRTQFNGLVKTNELN